VAWHDHLGGVDALEPLGGVVVLPLVASRGEITRDEDDVWAQAVDALDGRPDEVLAKRDVAAAQASDLNDPQGHIGGRRQGQSTWSGFEALNASVSRNASRIVARLARVRITDNPRRPSS
jgi:hypothetical protein